MYIEEYQIQEIIDDLEDTKQTLIDNNGSDWIITDVEKALSKLSDLLDLE